MTVHVLLDGKPAVGAQVWPDAAKAHKTEHVGTLSFVLAHQPE